RGGRGGGGKRGWRGEGVGGEGRGGAVGAGAKGYGPHELRPARGVTRDRRRSLTQQARPDATRRPPVCASSPPHLLRYPRGRSMAKTETMAFCATLIHKPHTIPTYCPIAPIPC